MLVQVLILMVESEYSLMAVPPTQREDCASYVISVIFFLREHLFEDQLYLKLKLKRCNTAAAGL